MKNKPIIPYKYKTDLDRDTPKLHEYLIFGGTDKEKIHELSQEGLKQMEERYDCSDFRCVVFIRILYTYEKLLSDETLSQYLSTISNFPFENCSGNSMCTWTENHQILFSSCEYLFAKKYPYLSINGNMSSQKAIENSLKRINAWLDKIIKFGFSEFGSNNYYPETLAAIGNMIEFCDDEKIRTKFKIVLDLMLFEVFSSMTKDLSFNTATARAYIDNKTNYKNYMLPFIEALLGKQPKEIHEIEGCFTEMLKAKDKDGKPLYKIPDVFLKIKNKHEKEIKSSHSIEPKDYKKYCMKKYSEEDVEYALTSNAICSKELISNCVRYFDEKEMWQNSMLSPLRPFSNKFLYKTKLLNLIKSMIKGPFDFNTFGNGNISTYVIGNSSISSLSKYHINTGSFQQNTLSIVVNGISIFTNSPFKDKTEKGSPDYWIGSSTNPHLAQNKNVVFAIYNLKKHRTTHTYFPLEKFDEYDLSLLNKGFIFARSGDTNIMIKTNGTFKFGDSQNDYSIKQDNKMSKFELKQYDLLSYSKNKQFYIYELDEKMSFCSFINDRLKRDFYFKNNSLKYQDSELRYGKYFKINGKKINDKFKRFESDFVHDDLLNKGILKIYCDKCYLAIDLNNYSRFVGNEDE